MPDFKNLNRNLRIGATIIAFIVIGLLSTAVYLLNDDNNDLEELLDKKEVELSDCTKKSYKRFEYAKDLTDICNRFQSSRNAKREYLFKKGTTE